MNDSVNRTYILGSAKCSSLEAAPWLLCAGKPGGTEAAERGKLLQATESAGYTDGVLARFPAPSVW